MEPFRVCPFVRASLRHLSANVMCFAAAFSLSRSTLQKALRDDPQSQKLENILQ